MKVIRPRELRKFPVNSPLSGKLAAETCALTTGCTSTPQTGDCDHRGASFPTLVTRKSFLTALLALASCTAASGDPEIAASDAWARETAPGQSAAAVYLTIANRGSGDDRLIGISSPAAQQASLHETVSEDGIARMRAVDGGLALPAGETVRLEPGGAHIMLEGLTGPLRRGQRLEIQLRLERSGERRVEAQIVDPSAQGAAHGGH